jgi:hypothetical protein
MKIICLDEIIGWGWRKLHFGLSILTSALGVKAAQKFKSGLTV